MAEPNIPIAHPPHADPHTHTLSLSLSIRSQQTYLGVTPPVSTNHPTQMELDLTDSLVESLRAHNLFESPEEARKRYVVQLPRG
ncbi:hypothetical protein BC938DRAFT_470944 [Jimgerdemannia flammicorona]|uniref:Poly(A) polymerase nucleotidyltransferase domain-containing protein n=1 Tax=Jimgerdemannia flammicorona TaxID=994334 RepID=A0A433Q941_9FUNG|nr:hypothetical protein BC938DRAFT_470944 [Jimgerdemannia flammicorona]